MKTNLLKYLVAGVISIFVTKINLVAQSGYNCGTSQANQKVYANNPDLAQAEMNNNVLLSQIINANKQMKAVEQVYTIPVVFHVIHINGSENISDAQIQDQMAILNRDYSKLNADTANVVNAFKGNIADCNIQFALAKKDPNGNCTNGIDRIYSHKTDNANDQSKLNPWPRDKYLNVWVIKTMENAGTAGYAYYPSATSTYLSPFDGIIIIHQYIGSIGTANVTNSRALTHEIGHWLNLSHTWGNTNDPTVACGDDACGDTPDTKGHNNCSNRFDHFCTSSSFSISYDFAAVDTLSGNIDPTAVDTVVDNEAIFSSISANGLSSNSQKNGAFAFYDWGLGATGGIGDSLYANLTGAINTNKYYEVTVVDVPSIYNSVNLATLKFKVKRSASGPRTFAIRSSLNGFSSNLTPVTLNTLVCQTLNSPAGVFYIKRDTSIQFSGVQVNLPATYYTDNSVTPITFRIYAWNAEDSLGSFEVDDLILDGTTGLIENVENYMEYSYCSKMFTNDQKDRMRAALTSTVSGRNNLWTVANLAATGVTPTGTACAPKANFFPNKTTVCTGGSVIFTKAITLGTATSTKFYFDGGTPATSTASTSTITVTYNTPGVYPVSLVATNAQGTDSIYKTDFITVTNAYGDVQGNGFTESFQDENSFWYNWRVNNPDANANTWDIANVGYNSSKSAVMQGYLNYFGDVDDMISPALNLSYITGATLSFKYTAASKATSAADANEALKVYYSSNCGASWVILGGGTITGPALTNYGYYSGYYVPNASSNWLSKTITLPVGASAQNVRFKFEYKTGAASNNLYIDDININGVVGITEQANNFNLAIYPNPTTETSTISYHLTEKGNVKLEVVDLLGKKVADVANTNQAEGDYSFTLSKSSANLNNGIYFIRLTVNNTVVTKKLVIAE